MSNAKTITFSEEKDAFLWYADLEGILKNTPMPKSKPLFPLFEAVTNSLDALEQCTYSPTIEIHIIRDDNELVSEVAGAGRSALASIIGFRVQDNGVGFTEENLLSFRTYSSRQKADRGGKGVGRFLWLKAFDEVRIESTF